MKIPTWRKKIGALLSVAERVFGKSPRIVLSVAALASAASLFAGSKPVQATELQPPAQVTAKVSKYSGKFLLAPRAKGNSMLSAQHSSHSSHSSHASHASHASHSSGGWS